MFLAMMTGSMKPDTSILMRDTMNTMDWVAFILALVGALAWTPQIITWISRALTKPKLSIYLHTEPEIGYTFFGPIFNIKCALLSKHKDTIINKFSAIITHENGASYKFDWVGISEDLSQIQSPLGETVSIKKTSLPLVIKVLNTGVSQASVRFMPLKFSEKLKEGSVDAIKRYNFMKTSGQLSTVDEVDALLSEQHFEDVMKVFESEFIWIAGKYTVKFEFGSPNKFKYEKDEYTFELKQEDINELKNNISNIKLDIEQRAKSDNISDFKPKPINWIWRSPELRKKGQVEIIE